MAFVVRDGAIQALETPQSYPDRRFVTISDDYIRDYAEIWRTQPAVRTVVSFIARNIAQLGLHLYQRMDDDDRRRVTDHPFVRMMNQPNPRTTRFRFMRALVSDYCIFDRAYAVKMIGPKLVRIPPKMVTPKGKSWLWPEAFEVRGNRGKFTVPADRMLHLTGFNPDHSLHGSSPIEAIRRMLAEDYAAGEQREQTLRNGARLSGYLERPADAPEWKKDGKERFREQWREQFTRGGPQAGGTPILEDGMTFNSVAQTAEQLQYVQVRTLTREEVAVAYFIPPPMVGILDRATFSNITELHKMLYQDALGPWLVELHEDFDLQLLADLSEPSENLYSEFNLLEKLRGSIEEQAGLLQTSVGAPIMTRDEGRARLNLPAMGGDAAELITPLNVLVGGQASPTDSAPEPEPPGNASDDRHLTKSAGQKRAKARAPEAYEKKHEERLKAFFERQGRAVKVALGAKADGWWDEARWNRELGQDLYALAVLTSTVVGKAVADAIGAEYDEDMTLHYLKTMTGNIATAINTVTKAQLDAALDADDPQTAVGHVFEVAATARAAQAAVTTTTGVSGFATREAAKQAAGDTGRKTWHKGPNARPSHAKMDGETVGIDDLFSNGAQWPGDSYLPVEESAGCNCTLEIEIGA